VMTLLLTIAAMPSTISGVLARAVRLSRPVTAKTSKKLRMSASLPETCRPGKPFRSTVWAGRPDLCAGAGILLEILDELGCQIFRAPIIVRLVFGCVTWIELFGRHFR